MISVPVVSEGTGGAVVATVSSTCTDKVLVATRPRASVRVSWKVYNPLANPSIVVTADHGDTMTAPVPGQKHDFAPREFAGKEIVRGRAERRLDLHPLLIGETFYVIESAATNDANLRFSHEKF